MKRLLPWVSIFLVGLVVGVTLTNAQPTAKNPAGTVPNTVVVKYYLFEQTRWRPPVNRSSIWAVVGISGSAPELS